MRITVVTPLFPPDTAPLAGYTKELLHRLSKTYELQAVVYGTHPEHVAGVSFSCVDKRTGLFRRLIEMTQLLRSLARTTDVFIVENGASVELPILIVSLMWHTPYIFHTGDTDAHAHESRHPLRRVLVSLVEKRARAVLSTVPPEKPEILPLEEHPTHALKEWDKAWNVHVREISSQLNV